MLSFPSADGFAKETTGGRGGSVGFVTNLNDSGTGSFRSLADSDTRRIIMVMVNGTVNLLTNCSIKLNKTILGQTANGQGICFKRSRLNMIARTNVIVRFIRSRFGNESGNEGTCLFLRDSDGVIFDHCSFTWGTDETLTTFRNRNITIQYSIIAEPLHNSVHSKGPHGYAWFLGGKDVSVHHCLIAHADQRSPRFDNPANYTTTDWINNYRGVVDFRNNAVYNWDAISAHGLEGGGSLNAKLNFINNYYKSGPMSNSARTLLRLQKDDTEGWTYGQAYLNGNIMEGESDINADNWIGVVMGNGGSQSLARVNDPFPANYDFTESATDAKNRILNHVGCSLSRDSVDTRLVNNFINGDYTFEGSNGSTGGLIDSQVDVGGYPSLTGGTVQSSFDQLTAWLDDNGYTDRPALTDWTNSTQRDALGAYIAQIDPTTGYAIAELYANDLVADLIANENPDPEIDPQIVTLEARLENGSFGGGVVDFVNPEFESPEPIQSGTSVSVVATPFSGYQFLHWERNGLVLSLNSTYAYTVPNFDATLIGVFKLIPIVREKRPRIRKQPIV
jgi:hypothetical protein